MTDQRLVRRRGLQAASAVLVTMCMILLGAAALPASATGTTSTKAQKAASQSSAHSEAPVRYSAPVSGTTEDDRSVTGTFTPRNFHVKQGELVVTGMLRGTIEGDGQHESREFRRAVTMQVTDAQVSGAPSGGRMAGAAVGACDILNLDLGALDLNLLGLEVHLAPVHLDIIAQSGPGNLLGNLLCSVASLLDGPGGLGGLVNNLLQQLGDLLNQILNRLTL